MTDKLNKILIVVFLTLLIWTWAYTLQEKDVTFTGTLKVSPATDSSLLVTFSIPGSRPQKEIPLSPITFKGAPSRISDLQKQFRKEQLEFYYNPQEMGHEEGPFKLDMKEFLQKNDKTHEMALTLLSCSPAQIDVTIERLESRKISVQCVDENGRQVPGAVPEPAIVDIYVRKNFTGSATVTLTKQQINLARKQAVSVQPYVNLGVAGIARESGEKVDVTIPSEEQVESRSFQTTKPIGILMSQELHTKYTVTIVNKEELPSTFFIFASDEAYEAYTKMDHPLYIVITDSDVVDLSQVPPKKIIFNFPLDYVRSGEIEVDTSRIIPDVKIKIEPINGNAAL